jgi:4-hydroxy-3-methylbut-2-enyl diphosphate reductase
MEILTTKTIGYCFGVRAAIERADEALKAYPAVYCVGEVAHNKRVGDGLRARGLITVGAVDEIPDGGVLAVRAHGLPEAAYKTAEVKNLTVVEGSCKYVLRIHAIVREYYEKGFQIVIVGEKEHPEVVGTRGWCGDTAIVIDSLSDAEKLRFIAQSMCVVAQTTFDNLKWKEICKILRQMGLKTLEIFDTICYTTLVRQDETVKLAAEVDKMLVLGSRNSSNTNKLYQAAERYCEQTYFIESPADLGEIGFRPKDRIGITAGASTPAESLTEVIDYMANLNNEVTSQEFIKGVEDSFVSYRPGKRVKGAVIGVDEEGNLHVNIGGKKDGIVPVSDGSFQPDEFKAGDPIEAVIRSNKDATSGLVLLSKRDADEIREGDAVVETIRGGDAFELVLKEAVKGGMVSKIGAYRVFVPASQLRDHYVADLKAFEGKKTRLAVISIDDDDKKIVASALKVVERERAEREDKFWNSLEEGLVVNGKVKRIAQFGAFVSVDGFDCLAHNTDLAWTRVFKADDIVKIGQRYDFVVLSFERDKNRVSLGYKQLQPKPWDVAAVKYPVGTVVKGKVARITKFGAFIELEPGIDALCFLSEISHNWIQNVNEALKAGDEVEGKIIKNEEEGRKLTLSIKAVQPEPEIVTLQEQIEQELALADADEKDEKAVEKKKRRTEKDDIAAANEEFEKLEAEDAASKPERAKPDAKAKFEARERKAAPRGDSPRRPRSGSDSPDRSRQWSESASNNPFADLLKNLDLEKKEAE